MERKTSRVLLVLASLLGSSGLALGADLDDDQGGDDATHLAHDPDAYEAYYNESSHSDFIAIDAGNAPQANIAIQNPTPWPSYVNDTHFHTDGRVGELVIRKFLERNAKVVAPTPTINFNVTQPAGN